MSEVQVYTLQNGIRVLYAPSKSAVAHLGVLIYGGSRFETENEHGLAHMLEHCFFKGTNKRNSFSILSRLDSVGGELNAYTSKEEICLYATFVNKYFSRAAELLADILCNASFPEQEIEKEKGVIIDEIKSYKDAPDELIMDEFEELIFGNTSLGRNILGIPSRIKKYKRKHLEDYIHKYFCPEKIVIVISGNVSLKRTQSVISKYFESISFKLANKCGDKTSTFNFVYQPNNTTKRKRIYHVHSMLGSKAYGVGDEKRMSLSLLSNMLGGPALNSRLNMVVREKYGYTYHIESNYTTYSDTGIASIYFSCDKLHFEKSLRLIYDELKKICSKRLGVIQLLKIKKQLIGQFVIGSENRLGVLLGLGKSLLILNRVFSDKEIVEQIESVTASQILEVANEIYSEKNLSHLTYLPY